MKMNDEVKGMLGEMPFIPIASMGNSEPHLIVVGKGFVVDDETLAFFGWRQGTTSKNIENNGVLQIVVVSEKKDKGYRLAGTGRIEKEGAISDRCGSSFRSSLANLIS